MVPAAVRDATTIGSASRSDGRTAPTIPRLPLARHTATERPSPWFRDALAAGTRLGPYEIVAPLGAGGMGEVYRARDARVNRSTRVSPAGGSFARWRSDGKELFYRALDGQLNALSVDTSGERLKVGNPVPLFRLIESLGTFAYPCDVSTCGESRPEMKVWWTRFSAAGTRIADWLRRIDALGHQIRAST